MKGAVAVGLMLATAIAGESLGAGEDVGIRELSLGEDLQVRELAEGVWQHVCRVTSDGVTFSCNGMVVQGRDEALVVDTPWNNDQTERLLDWVAQALAPVRHVIVTHSHPDNMGGIDAVHARGIATYGLELTAEYAKKDGHAPPTQRFSERLDLVLGGVPVEASFLGAGHTRDNIVVWLPGQRILFGGCLVKSADAQNLGFTGEADLDAWPETLERVKQRFGEARLILPGHGAPGGQELIENTLRLLRERAATAPLR
jgi:metallo-beta-lactamase class B